MLAGGITLILFVLLEVSIIYSVFADLSIIGFLTLFLFIMESILILDYKKRNKISMTFL